MYQKILVGIDPAADERGSDALAIATQLAEDNMSQIAALTVLEALPSYFADHLIAEAETQAAELALGRLRELCGRYSEVKTEIRHGKPADELLKYAEANGIDCIVIASHKPGITDYFLGSTAARVVRHAPCSVHVIR